ncbi:MAG: 16S rRNA (guanine(966)-N(2))-methyltransferase RsmD [Gallionellaceae bacterium]|nr:16S rRNA (guanine(966)-N(2))-methyltransferase RsmD [Gallionellaceae bacterium]
MANIRGSEINKVRIIGGTHRSRFIEFPDAEGLRPTPDRVRETLFNWLGQTLYGKRCLDLFAGSGALGFEAASRGAEQVVMVENNRAVFRSLQNNLAKLGLSNVALRCEDGLKFARQDNGLFDVVFLDPPFKSDCLPQLLPVLGDMLAPQGMVYLESGTAFEPDASWKVLKRARAGAVHYQLLERI